MTSEEIKQAYSMREITARYGLVPNRAGFISCPFHQEKTASCKIYKDSYYCFGCGCTGDIFSFVQQMDGLTFREAFEVLGGKYEQSFTAKYKSDKAMRRRRRAEKEALKLEEDKCLNNLLISVYRKWLDRLEPLSDGWCGCYNALQKEIRKNEYLNEMR